MNPRDVDARTDLWSLGVTFYELLTGRPPFEGETVAHLLTLILQVTPVPMRSLRPGLAAGLEAVISKCLEKNRELRWATVADLAAALTPFCPKRARVSVERIGAILNVPIAGAAAGSTFPMSPMTLGAVMQRFGTPSPRADISPPARAPQAPEVHGMVPAQTQETKTMGGRPATPKIVYWLGRIGALILVAGLVGLLLSLLSDGTTPPHVLLYPRERGLAITTEPHRSHGAIARNAR